MFWRQLRRAHRKSFTSRGDGPSVEGHFASYALNFRCFPGREPHIVWLGRWGRRSLRQQLRACMRSIGGNQGLARPEAGPTMDRVHVFTIDSFAPEMAP